MNKIIWAYGRKYYLAKITNTYNEAIKTAKHQKHKTKSRYQIYPYTQADGKKKYLLYLTRCITC